MPAPVDRHLREVLSHASVAFAVKILAAILSFCLSVVLARLLGAEDTGHYYLIFTIVTIAALIARSGVDRASLRYVASSQAMDNPANVARVYKLSVLIVSGIGALATIALLTSSNLLAVRVFSASELATLLVIAAFAIVPIALFNLHAELLKGLKRTGVAIAIQSAWLPTLTLIGVATAVPRFSLIGAVTSMTLASFITLAIAVMHWWRSSPPATGEGTLTPGELMRASRPLFWVGIFQLSIAHTATIVLGIFQDAAEIGRFAVAIRTSALISFVLFAVNSIAAPKFAELHRQGRLDDLQATAVHSAALMTVMALPFLFLFVLAPIPIMSIFGSDFSSGAPVLAVLAIGQFINVVTGSVGYLLAMTGHGKPLRNTLALSAGLHVALCFAVAPHFGAVGAALAMAFTVAFMNVRLTYSVWQHLGIVPLPFLGKFLEKRQK